MAAQRISLVLRRRDTGFEGCAKTKDTSTYPMRSKKRDTKSFAYFCFPFEASIPSWFYEEGIPNLG